MKWEKKGLIYCPHLKVRAYLPTVDLLEDRLRVYYSSLDFENIGRIYYVDLDKEDPKKIIDFGGCVLREGSLGEFDEHGVTPSCIITIDGTKFLYYYGWMKTTHAPQIMFTGLALGVDGKTFIKPFNVPILDRIQNEYTNRAALYVIKDENMFRGYYTGSLSGFVYNFQDKKVPSYTIKSVFSFDGISWLRSGEPIELRDNEFGLSRSCVVKDGKHDYKMWYSIRSFDEPYKLGYAESENGVDWERKDDQVGITWSDTRSGTWSENGWDSEMICFPYVVDVNGKRLMFYNGNNHGESGFGYAELVQ